MNPDSEPIAEDFLDFKCPYCEAFNSFPASAAGGPQECINCLEPFLVPLADGQPAQPLPLPMEFGKLRLRRFEPGDWQDLLEFQFDEEDEATGWLLAAAKTRFTDPNQPFSVAVATRDNGKVVGTFGLRFAGQDLSQAKLSLTFAAPGPFAGFESEAMRAIFDFGFRGLRLHRIFAECFADEPETRRFFQEAGMRQEAEFVKNFYLNGEWLTTFWFALLEEEYLGKAGDGKTS